jgi:hypothetical protein
VHPWHYRRTIARKDRDQGSSPTPEFVDRRVPDCVQGQADAILDHARSRRPSLWSTTDHVPDSRTCIEYTNYMYMYMYYNV